jgi:hypothetical protein
LLIGPSHLAYSSSPVSNAAKVVEPISIGIAIAIILAAQRGVLTRVCNVLKACHEKP